MGDCDLSSMVLRFYHGAHATAVRAEIGNRPQPGLEGAYALRQRLSRGPQLGPRDVFQTPFIRDGSNTKEAMAHG